jgi:hypothetical protein
MFVLGRVEFWKRSRGSRRFCLAVKVEENGSGFFYVMIVSSVVRDLASHAV